MSQHEILKFELNKTYNLILSFDKPQEYDGKFGKSIMYGATMQSDEVRFYASKGLHQEIQSQELKKDDRLEIKKVQPGDFSYFVVNGKSKHLEETSKNHNMVGVPESIAKIVPIASAPDDIQFDQTWITRIETLENVVEELSKKLMKDDEVPF